MASRTSDAAVYALALGAERVLGFLLLPLLTRGLPPEEYGAWSQTVAWSSLLMPFVTLGLPTVIVRFYSARQTGLAAAMRHTYAIGAAAAVLVAAIVLLFPHLSAAAVYGDRRWEPLLPGLALIVTADALLDLAIAWLRCTFRIRRIAVLIAARGAIRLGTMIVAILVLRWPLPQALVLCGAALLALVPAAIVRHPGWIGGAGRQALDDHSFRPAVLAPVVLMLLLAALQVSMERILVTQLLGLEAVAVYSAAAALVAWIGLVATAIGFVAFPALASAAQDRAAQASLMERITTGYVFVVAPLVLLMAALGADALPLLATGDYRVGSGLMLMLSVAVAAYGAFQIALYLLLLDDRGMLACGLIAGTALLGAALNATLVPTLGIAGAAVASLGSNSLLAAAASHAARSRRRPGTALLGPLSKVALPMAAAFVAVTVSRQVLPRDTWGGILGCAAALTAAYVLTDIARRSSFLLTAMHRRPE